MLCRGLTLTGRLGRAMVGLCLTDGAPAFAAGALVIFLCIILRQATEDVILMLILSRARNRIALITRLPGVS